MKRYHKNVYFKHETELKEFNVNMNIKKWKYSSHALKNLQYRVIDNLSILTFIKGLVLNEKDIFEYYIIDNKIDKVCYRIEYIYCDIILIVSKQKCIITIYLNSKNDNHNTLKTELYQTT